MLKRIISPKNVLFLTLFTVLLVCFLAIFLIPTLSGSKADAQSEGRYKIGERVTDPGGSLWEYTGNFRIELGQLTKDMKLLSISYCGTEKQAFFIHEESIPNVVVGDTFKLIVPSTELNNLLLSTPGLPDRGGDKINVTVSDPPAFSQGSRNGTVCCMIIFDQD